MAEPRKVVHTGVSDQSDYLMVEADRQVLDVCLLLHGGSGSTRPGEWGRRIANDGVFRPARRREKPAVR